MLHAYLRPFKCGKSMPGPTHNIFTMTFYCIAYVHQTCDNETFLHARVSCVYEYVTANNIFAGFVDGFPSIECVVGGLCIAMQKNFMRILYYLFIDC